jgi:acetaldehyde dehydrogenase (acetylating)
VQQLDPDLRALQEVRDMVARAKSACEAIHRYDQKQADALCAAMAKAAASAAYDLGRLAVEETGIGRVHYKVLKNLFGAEGTWASIKDEKTVGIVRRDERNGVIEVATAAGVIAGIIPTTNPTSTAIYKALISVKGKNAIVISPHPRARRCIGETVEVMRRALERLGAPADLVCCLSNPTIESTGALMKHKDVALILATGGTGLVKAAYSSGKPAYGVGPGNVPVYVDRSADVAAAAAAITSSQSFDNATLCCSEQGIVMDKPIAKQLVTELVKRGAHVCDERETEKLARLCNRGGHMNPDVVGIDPYRIAEMAGFNVPRATTILLAHQGGIGKEWPLSIEILAPVLSLHTVDGWEEGCKACIQMLEHEGLGHTLGIHCRDQAVLDAFFLEKPANRILVNGPCSQGAVGYSTNLVPSMSLGCGPEAGNITSDNISAKHLINIKRVAYLRRDWNEIERKDHARAAGMAGSMAGDPAPRGSGLPGDPALESSAPIASSSAFSAEPQSNWRGNPPLAREERSAGASMPSHASSAATGTLRSKVQPALKSQPPQASLASSVPQASGTSPMSSGSQSSSSSRTSSVSQPLTSSHTSSGSPSSSALDKSSGSQASSATFPPSMARASSAPAQPSSHSGSGVRSPAPTFTSPISSVATATIARPSESTIARAASPYVGAAFSPSEIQVLMSHAGSGCPLGPCKGCPHHEVTTGACLA